MPLKLKRYKTRGPNWYIRGTVHGIYIDETTGTAERADAEDIRIVREAQLVRQAIHGVSVDRTFADAAVEYVATAGLKGTQRYAIIGKERRDGTMSPNLVDAMGALLCRKVSQETLDQFVRDHHSASAATTIIRQVITPATAVLTYAAARKWCDEPKFSRPKLTRAQRKGRRDWATVEQATRMAVSAAPHLQPLLIFLFWSGVRLSEALDLQWSDVNLEARWAVLVDTKNGEDRGIPLHTSVVVALANIKGRDGHVFRTHFGHPYADRERIEGGQIKTAWAYARRKAGIEKLTPHGTRHSCSTWLIMAGVPEPIKDEILGHASGSVGRRYTHVPRQPLLDAIDKLPICEISVKEQRPAAPKAKRQQGLRKR